MSRSSTFGQRDINSNPTTAAQRNLTLTEELEKLEQSITLTLQGHSISCPNRHTLLTYPLRDRSQFQSGPPNCNGEHPTGCRAVCRAFKERLGRLQSTFPLHKFQSRPRLTPPSSGNSFSKPPPTFRSPATRSLPPTTKPPRQKQTIPPQPHPPPQPTTPPNPTPHRTSPITPNKHSLLHQHTVRLAPNGKNSQ